MLNRRQLIGGAAATLAKRWSYALGDAGVGYPRTRYDRAIVIDALGGLGEFVPDAAADAPLSARALADVRESGVTAVNLTINDVGNGPNKFAGTVKNIADMEHELAAHPDVLMKILRGADIQAAKSTKRLGIIYGCQDTTMLEGDHRKNLTVFANLGVRIVQPTYNVRNLMGDGCIEKADGGLSKLGYDFIAQVNRLNLLLDLSQLLDPRHHRRRHCGIRGTDGHHAHRLSGARGSAAQYPRLRIEDLGGLGGRSSASTLCRS